MPEPFRVLFFAAIMLASASAGAGFARAEMTEADKAGMLAFDACLDENGSDEGVCTEKLGLFAWYPRNDTICEAIGKRVNNIIELGGNPVWRELFQNERCARLGMPHGAAGLPSPPNSTLRQQYTVCRNNPVQFICLELIGRHEDLPTLNEIVCPSMARRLSKAGKRIYFRWWDTWFENERCWRLGGMFFDTTKAPHR